MKLIAVKENPSAIQYIKNYEQQTKQEQLKNEKQENNKIKQVTFEKSNVKEGVDHFFESIKNY